MAHLLFARKSLETLHKEATGEHRLRRVLGPMSLTSLGIGCIIGAGIFVITGKAASTVAGPALILSFVVAGLACIFAALCYAEFAAMVPVAGSAYTYAYATMGELFAWIIGWDLVLEYTVASASVASGWSHYFQIALDALGMKWPAAIGLPPFDIAATHRGFISTGALVDLPALLIIMILTVILVVGIRESARFNNAMVVIKLLVVAMVIVLGVQHINPANWHPFAPYGWTGIALFGKTIFGQTAANGAPLGMLAGAALVFFAFIGFDSVSTHAEEAREPQRDVPIGIMGSLLICTLLYIAVSAIITGMVPYNQISINAPIAEAFKQLGLTWAQGIISVGAIAGLTSVLMVLMLSQPRVLLAIARDGLLPRSFFGAIHARFRTPWKSTILTGLVVAILAGFVPLNILAELVNIGTLLAFVMVCLAVLIMRKTEPAAHRPFRTPWVPVVPILGIAFCLLLMFSLPGDNWLRLVIWLAVGLVIYFTYGRHHSILARERRGEHIPEPSGAAGQVDGVTLFESDADLVPEKPE
jgi:APA family basic amino acid/polyamine antiporter